MSRTKDSRPKARAPRGFRDRIGAEVAAEQEMLEKICSVYRSFGFEALETPALEYTDALGKFLPDTDRPNEGVFSLQDDDEQWMSLRYDLTAPLARFVAENFDALPKPFRRFAVGQVWRNEKPGPGRYRQFTQCDADTVGAPAPHADVECCMMLAAALQAAGVGRNDYVVKFNDRNVLTGLLEQIGLAADEHGARRLGVLRAMDKLDRLGEAGVALLLGAGRKDDSGDYTKGADLSDRDIEAVLSFMRATKGSNAATCDALGAVVGGTASGAKGVETLGAMSAQLSALGLSDDRVRIDLSVIRGLEYYTGPVFEVELTAAVVDEKGRLVRLGSVASGGRYDDLVKRFKGVEVPAVGVSIGVSRLLAALEILRPRSLLPQGPVVILALDKDAMTRYQAMAAELRAAGVVAEVYLGGAGMKAQIKYADKRGSRVAVIEGGDEHARGEVTIKDLLLGARLAESIADNAEWREAQPAQFSVPRDRLVASVKDVLARR